jgi:hypothetical protein
MTLDHAKIEMVVIWPVICFVPGFLRRWKFAWGRHVWTFSETCPPDDMYIPAGRMVNLNPHFFK